MGEHHKLQGGGWSRVVKLISGNTNRNGSLQRSFDRPQAYTVSFSIAPDDDISAANVATIRAEALIEFIVEGNTYTRRVSVANGISVTGVCNSIRVRVDDKSTAEGGATVLGKKYHISIQVAPGTRGDSSAPPFLQEENIVFVINAGTNRNIPIPEGAGVKTLLATVVALNGAVVLDGQARVTQTTAAATAIAMYDPRSFSWAPIAPGATMINLANLSPTTQTWALFWGIDG